jgi:uroporphyrinogen-III synthase
MRLAVMRPMDRIEDAVKMAKELGFEVAAASPLTVRPIEDPQADEMIDELSKAKVDVVILTSSTGVHILADAAEHRGTDLATLLTSCFRVAIGPLTARAMVARGSTVDLIPQEHSSEGLVRQLGKDMVGRRVYLLRSSHGERILYDGLAEAGAEVTEKVLYDLVPDLDSPPLRQLVKETLEGRIDAFAFTSSLSAVTFIEASEKVAPRAKVVSMLNSKLVAAMGAPTRRKLEGMGIRVDVVPTQATFPDMLEAILEHRL